MRENEILECSELIVFSRESVECMRVPDVYPLDLLLLGDLSSFVRGIALHA